jgi:hypothetical protein
MGSRISLSLGTLFGGCGTANMRFDALTGVCSGFRSEDGRTEGERWICVKDESVADE